MKMYENYSEKHIFLISKFWRESNKKKKYNEKWKSGSSCGPIILGSFVWAFQSPT